MAKRTPIERLDDAVEAIMADPGAPLPHVDRSLAALLRIAAHLRELPSEKFKSRLKDELTSAHSTAAVKPSYRAEPYLRVRGAAQLLDFLKDAFGAEETSRARTSEGVIVHAEARIGDTVIGIGDAAGEDQPMPTALHVYVPDADATYKQAMKAGATSLLGPTDQNYGDREASIKDRWGNHWYIATHKVELSAEELKGAKRRSKKPVTSVSYIPAGLRSVTPYLHPIGADTVIDFLKRAFAADEMLRVQPPGDVVHHAKIRIGESVVELGEAHGQFSPMPTVFHLYVNDTDAVYRRAVAAGGVSLREPVDQPWGMRNAGVQDPGGNQWWINMPLPH